MSLLLTDRHPIHQAPALSPHAIDPSTPHPIKRLLGLLFEVFLNNLGSTGLSMRIALGGPDSFDTWYASVDAVPLQPGSGWTAVSFPIGEADLTRVEGSNSYAQTLSNVHEVRILSAANPALRGDRIAATLGIDDVTVVPEPATMALWACGLLAVTVTRRRVPH